MQACAASAYNAAMTNLSTLQRNTLLGLSEEAEELYLRGCERDELRAFFMADEWNVISDPLKRMLAATDRSYRHVSGDVYAFMMERHYRRWFPGN